MTCVCLQVGSRNQFSKAAQDCCARGWSNLASPLAAVVPTVARTVGTPGANAIASITNATAEIVTAIVFNMNTDQARPSALLSYAYVPQPKRAIPNTLRPDRSLSSTYHATGDDVASPILTSIAADALCRSDHHHRRYAFIFGKLAPFACRDGPIPIESRWS